MDSFLGLKCILSFCTIFEPPNGHHCQRRCLQIQILEKIIRSILIDVDEMEDGGGQKECIRADDELNTLMITHVTLSQQ